MEKLIPIGDLGKLTEAEKRQYYVQVCEHFSLPPELNLIEFMWMDSGDSGRKLILYAKKGATDRLRDLRGISVTKLTEFFGDGFVMFTAEGRDEKSRTEIAVGAHETRGLSGKTLADAIAIAQTKAVRRMTLQFVGGGFLDESEVTVPSVTRDLATAPAMLSQLATQPVNTPNAGAGRDITTAEPVPVERKKRRRGTVTLEPVQPPTFDLSEEPLVDTVPEPAKAEPVPTGAVERVIAVLTSPVVPVEKLEPIEERMERIFPKPPTESEMKIFRNQLFKYTEDILPKGGMVAATGIGGVNAKMRLFVKTLYPDAELGRLSTDQWTKFLELIDNTFLTVGATGLVEHINKAIGAKE